MKQLSDDCAYNFIKVGKEFAEAGKILNQHHRNAPSWPTYFVACQALELYLKAFLRAKGMSLKDLRNKIGHDLLFAFCKAKEMGLGKVVSITKDDEHMIEILNPIYSKRDFQYKSSGEWALYPVGVLISFLDRSQSALLEQVVH